MIVERTKIKPVKLSEALTWQGSANEIFEEKIDGVWGVRRFPEFAITCENMIDGSFYALDIISARGTDCRHLTLKERLVILDYFSAEYNLLRPDIGRGGDFLRSVLSKGGEGVVKKLLDCPFGVGQFKAKRIETFDLKISAIDYARASIRLSQDGEDIGWCQAKAVIYTLKVGMTVEIEAMNQTAAGKLREPRFKRIRFDKAA